MGANLATKGPTWTCFISTLLLVVRLGHALRLTNMSAPVVADTRKDMELSCHFDMESEELYAVKWYKDDQEFFRFMPHQQPHTMNFPVSGVHLVLQGSHCRNSSCKVQLTKLSRHHSDGAYRCEVSSEAPTFRLAAETHNITVATLPKEKPRIQGLEDSYNEGDILSANCITSPSDPAALLTWYINKDEASSKFVEDLRTTEEDGLLFRSLELHFQVNRKHAQAESDAVVLRCVSRLPGIPQEPQEASRAVVLKVHRPQVVSNEKLHWMNSAADRQRFFAALLLATAVRW